MFISSWTLGIKAAIIWFINARDRIEIGMGPCELIKILKREVEISDSK